MKRKKDHEREKNDIITKKSLKDRSRDMLRVTCEELKIPNRENRACRRSERPPQPAEEERRCNRKRLRM